MTTFNQLLLLAGIVASLSLGTGELSAPQRGRGNQGQGRNFDPVQARQRMLDGYKDRLEVENDDEWKIIQERIEKVLQAQRELRVGGFGRGGGGNRRGGNDNAQTDNNGGGRTNRGGIFGIEPNPELEALQKALDSKAPPDEVKTKIAKLRESLKGREAKLAAAQEELRKVLSMRQEGLAM